MSGLTSITPPQPLFRLGRRPDAWAWPPPEYCRKANRWDDPTDTYRVLYACSQRRGAFVETLARFRPDPAVVAGVAAVVGDDEGALAPGEVPASWLAPRAIGTATVDGHFVDIGHSETLAHLQTAMAARLIHYGVHELDGSVIREARRELTQEMSLHVFKGSHVAGAAFAGIAYESRLGNEFMNWAIFERPSGNAVQDASSTSIHQDDPDLVATFRLFNLKLVRGR